MKNLITTGITAFVLASCSPKTENIETSPIANSSQNTIDSLKKVIAEKEQHILSQQGEMEKKDSIIGGMTRYPDRITEVLKKPFIPQISKKDYIENGQLLEKDEFLKKLQKKTRNEKSKLVVEGSIDHHLYLDSTVLYNTFSEGQGSLNIQVQKKYTDIKNGVGLQPAEEDKLHDWFIGYLEGKKSYSNGGSEVRSGVIHTEKLGGVTIYYTDMNKKRPGIIAKHPNIKPSSHSYTWKNNANIFDDADYFDSRYKEPTQPIITISKIILEEYGIKTSKQIKQFLLDVNSHKAIKTKSKPKLIVTKIAKLEPETELIQNNKLEPKPNNTNLLYKFDQEYTISTNGSHELTIRDFDTFDFDKIKVNQPDFPDGIIIEKKPAILDTRKLQNGELIVEIVYEGHKQPCTFAFKIGNHEQQINGKKGDKILLKFQ